MKAIIKAFAALIAVLSAPNDIVAATKPVRVFVLAGQSNMEGQGFVPASPERNGGKGNVAFVGTRAFWRSKEDSPTGQGYHWNSNAETYYLIGEAMGKAMKQLLGVN